ncbi:hypothetical protein PRUPE_3G073500 [Prunus persica]|uniref:Uncharacterized protein n=1 Tax=Prunus persica TaxID=3760 RepID=A0A251PWS6_PRUPE|nr:structure-specific endonuclease subunit SLX1 isoform X2 [Prunus persica]ONI16001.1 hypothetical protein PRUPE_3G073500 [Prunus persica]
MQKKDDSSHAVELSQPPLQRPHLYLIHSEPTASYKTAKWCNSARCLEMVLCIYVYQFEWAWQHPTVSKAVRQAAASFKSLGGVVSKIKLAYTMLTLPPWQRSPSRKIALETIKQGLA